MTRDKIRNIACDWFG